MDRLLWETKEEVFAIENGFIVSKPVSILDDLFPKYSDAMMEIEDEFLAE